MKEIISNGQASQAAMYSFEYKGVTLKTGSNGSYFDISPEGYLKQKVSLKGANETTISYWIMGYGSLKGLGLTIDAWDEHNSIFAIKEVDSDTEEYKFILDIVSASEHSILVKNGTRKNIQVVLISALLEDGNAGVTEQVGSLSDKMILYGYERDLPVLVNLGGDEA